MSKTLASVFVVGSLAVGLVACGGDEPAPAKPTGCDAAVEMADGTTASGTTKGGSSLDTATCVIGEGLEARYRIVPTQTGMLDLTLGSAVDLAMYVRTTCGDAASEIGCSDLEKEGVDEKLSVPVTAGEPVWVVIDGASGTSPGPFTLTAKSRPISCGDSLVEGQEECDPPDAGKTCTAECKKVPEACGDGIDNDVDGLIDCEDAVDCGSDAAACPLMAACGAATAAQASQMGDASKGSGDFAGSCTGGALSPEAIYTYVPASAGALLVTLQSATNQGVYVRKSCMEPMTEIGCLDDQPGGKSEVLVVPVASGAEVTLFVDAAKPTDSGPFTLETMLEPSTEVEPNNATTNATAYGGATFVGTIDPGGDMDFVKIDVPAAGAKLTATIEDFGNGDCANFKLDTVVEVLGPDGTTSLALNDDTGNFCSLAEATTTAAGTHYVRVSASDHNKDAHFAYRLTLSVQ